MWLRLGRIAQTVVVLALVAVSLRFSGPRPEDEQDRARAYTRDIEFDYVGWMLDALARQGTRGGSRPAHLLGSPNKPDCSLGLPATHPEHRASGGGTQSNLRRSGDCRQGGGVIFHPRLAGPAKRAGPVPRAYGRKRLAGPGGGHPGQRRTGSAGAAAPGRSL